jgi:hypothetical protein
LLLENASISSVMLLTSPFSFYVVVSKCTTVACLLIPLNSHGEIGRRAGFKIPSIPGLGSSPNVSTLINSLGRLYCVRATKIH